MLAAHDIAVDAGRTRLLEGVSLAVEAGELLAVVGPNGAGKSTLVRALTGEHEVAEGWIELNGRPLPTWRRRDAARLRGVLPQSSSLSFPFRAYEVVLMGRNPHVAGTEAPRDHEIARAAMERADIAHLRDRLYPTLSGGEQQRVQLARVLAQIWEPPADRQARVMILDEPTSSLDIAHQHAVLGAARHLSREGVCVLAVLHDLNLAAAYADRMAVLHRGRLRAVGAIGQVCRSDLLGEVFGVPLEINWDEGRTHPTIMAYRAPDADADATAGVDTAF